MNMSYPLTGTGAIKADGLRVPDANRPAGTTAGAPLSHPSGAPVTRDAWEALHLERPDIPDRLRDAVPLVDRYRDHPAAKAFDLLRTRLVRALTQHGWTRIAVVAPTSGCGSTFTAVNLALSLARVPGSRSILVDLDQRAPGVAEALGLIDCWPICDFLSGREAMEDYLIRCSETLAVAPNTETNPDAAEQLHDGVAAAVLEDMEEDLAPDLVLYDLPAMLEYDDAAAFLPHVDGVLLVADGTRTLPRHITECERILEGQTRLLGVVLNRGRPIDA